MKQEWKEFLAQNGAEFSDENTVESFGSMAREIRVNTTGLVITDLSHFGLISVNGSDAATYLQGQVTNDINKIDLASSQLNAICNSKGRMLANFRVFKHENTLYLCLPRALVEPVLARLRMFVMRSDVQLEDASDTMVHIGISGETSEAQLAGMCPELPAEVDHVSLCASYLVIRTHGMTPRFEVFGDLAGMKTLWQTLDVHAAPIGAGPWNRLDILSGIPVIEAANSDAFVPQMVNMQLINGVSFQKGCYTGQEIVARMHYLGKLKRRMYRVHINTDTPVKPGDQLTTPDSGNGQYTGTIVSAQVIPDGGHEALAVIQVKEAESASLHLLDPTGPTIKVLDLPYSFDEEQHPDHFKGNG